MAPAPEERAGVGDSMMRRREPTASPARPVDVIDSLLILEGVVAAQLTAEEQERLISAAHGFESRHNDRIRHGQHSRPATALQRTAAD